MTTPLFDYSIAAELRRLADAAERQAAATEGLLALETARQAAAAPAPADFDSAQYADAFDAKMGNPLAALGRLTPVAQQQAADKSAAFTDYCAQFYPDAHALLVATSEASADSDDYTRRVRWSNYCSRCNELARLRTDAKHRKTAAKTPAVRAAALREERDAERRSKRRHDKMRPWLAEGKIVIDDDKLYLVTADGVRVNWSPDFISEN